MVMSKLQDERTKISTRATIIMIIIISNFQTHLSSGKIGYRVLTHSLVGLRKPI